MKISLTIELDEGGTISLADADAAMTQRILDAVTLRSPRIPAPREDPVPQPPQEPSKRNVATGWHRLSTRRLDILRVLATAHPRSLNITQIYRKSTMPPKSGQMWSQMAAITEHGLVIRVKQGVYRISDIGLDMLQEIGVPQP